MKLRWYSKPVKFRSMLLPNPGIVASWGCLLMDKHQNTSRNSLEFIGIHKNVSFLSFFHWLWGVLTVKLWPPNRSRKTGKLILELGRKWSRGGPKVVPECWFLVLNQNDAVPAGTCLSARIMILCQDHHPLPTSWSSAKTMIVSQQYDSPSKNWPGAPPQINCF